MGLCNNTQDAKRCNTSKASNQEPQVVTKQARPESFVNSSQAAAATPSKVKKLEMENDTPSELSQAEVMRRVTKAETLVEDTNEPVKKSKEPKTPATNSIDDKVYKIFSSGDATL